jgi:hypothetical protein
MFPERPASVKEITFSAVYFFYPFAHRPTQAGATGQTGDLVMKARFLRLAGVKSRARRASTVGLFLTLFASAAQAQQGTPEQRRACTPDVYRLCAGEIPNVRAITACLRRNRSSLSEACRSVFDQAGG